MAASQNLPSVEQVRECMLLLLGDGCTVSVAKRKLSKPDVCGVFVRATGECAATIVADAAFANRAGAALAMLPSGRAEDAIRAGSVDEDLFVNLSEVINVCGGLLNSDVVPHVRMTEVARGQPDDAADVARHCGGRADFVIDVPRYGTGLLSFVSR